LDEITFCTLETVLGITLNAVFEESRTIVTPIILGEKTIFASHSYHAEILIAYICACSIG